MEREALGETLLFRDMSGEEIEDALAALRVEEKRYRRGAAILRAGDTTERMGLVLRGGVTIESNDLWGGRTILSYVGEGQVFAETYALLRDAVLLVDVIANEDSRVLFFRTGGLRALGGAEHPWLFRLAANLLAISAHKNLALSERSFHIAPKSARGRIMAYLNAVSLRAHGKEFDVPFDRQQMADYLNLERSALSKELGRMRDDGLIRFRKNHFVILAQDGGR